MPSIPFDAILFDCDGVLVDSEPITNRVLAEMLGDGTETDAYLRVSKERYRLMRTHEWSEDVLARVRADEGGR